MERLGASSLLPLAIRARLSTEDSASDASSSSLGDSDGIDVSEEEESYETAVDDAAFLRRPSMPRARITGDDDNDDDVLEEAVFEDNDEEEEENLKLAVEEAETVSSNGGDYEDFGGGFVAGIGEGVFSNAGNENEFEYNSGDGGLAVVSLEDMHLRVNAKGYFEKVEKTAALDNDLANGGGLESMEVKLEIDGSDAKVKLEKDRYGAVERTSDFSSEVLQVEKIDIEKDNLACDVEEFVSGREESSVGSNGSGHRLVYEDFETTSLKELPIQVEEKVFSEKVNTMHVFEDALENDDIFELNEVKLEMDGSDVVEVDVEEGLDSIAAVYDKIGAVKYGDVEQINDFAVELTDSVVESSNMDIKGNNFSTDLEKTQKSVMEMESSAEVEADFTRFKGSEPTNAVDFIHKKIVEIVSLPDSKGFESKPTEADNMGMKKGNLFVNTCPVDSQKTSDSSCKLHNLTGYENDHEICFPIKEICEENTVAYHAELLDSVEEKHESRAIVTQVSITESCNPCEYSSDEFLSYYASGKEMETIFDSFCVAHDEKSGEEDEPMISEWAARHATLEKSEIVKHILEEMEGSSSSSQSDFKSPQNRSHILDSQINSGEEVKTEEGCIAEELFDTSALAALLRADRVASSEVSNLTSEDSSSIFSVNHQAGLRSTTFMRSTHAPFRSAFINASSNCKIAGECGNRLNDEEKVLQFRADQKIRLRYLHLVQRLGHFAGTALPDQVLYHLGLVSGMAEVRKFCEESCIEEKCKDDLAFSCNILVIGKTGVGKSAVINSIFGEERAPIDAFQPATTSVREISGMVDGVYVSVIDTPGLLTSLHDQRVNRKILSSVKKYTKRTPDVVLYVDRVDTHARDLDDLAMLRMITGILGSSIWHNAIIVLTHAASAFPEEPDGSPLSYEAIVAQRSRAIQQAIRQAAVDAGLVNPVALVENHHSCTKNMDGERLLPNGLRWRAWLLLLCYSTKILSEVHSILKPSRNQRNHNHVFDVVSDNMTNEVPEGDEYDQLPSFTPSRRSQAQDLTNEQKNTKQWRGGQGFNQEEGPSAVPIMFPDMASLPSFDSEDTTRRYLLLEPKSQLLTRPVMCSQYWDHDSAYDDVMIKENIGIVCLFPVPLSVQITIDKKELGLYLGCSISSKNEENGFRLASIQPIGNQLFQGVTKFSNLKKNKATAGILFTFLGDTLTNEFKLDDLVFQGKNLRLSASNGMVQAESADTYGASLELHLNKNCSSRKRLFTPDLSVIKWRNFSLGAYLQFELSSRQNSRISVCVGINNTNSGQISIKTSTTNQVYTALLGLFTIVLPICRSIWTNKTI